MIRLIRPFGISTQPSARILPRSWRVGRQDDEKARFRARPALVERIAIANSAAADSARKLDKADKLIGAFAYVEPDRIAGAAEKLLARRSSESRAEAPKKRIAALLVFQ